MHRTWRRRKTSRWRATGSCRRAEKVNLPTIARDGPLAALPRFGSKTAENVRRGIASLRQATGLRLFHHARDELEGVRLALAELEGVQRVEIAGAVRRRCDVIARLDLIAVH